MEIQHTHTYSKVELYLMCGILSVPFFGLPNFQFNGCFPPISLSLSFLLSPSLPLSLCRLRAHVTSPYEFLNNFSRSPSVTFTLRYYTVTVRVRGLSTMIEEILYRELF